MATEVKLPRLGQGMESGTIVRWLKAEGDEVTKGEPLYELDTDKVTQEVEAEADGVLLKIVITEGEADVGTTVGLIGAAGEDVSALLEAQGGNGGAPAASPAPTTPAAPPVTSDEPAQAVPPVTGEARDEPRGSEPRASSASEPASATVTAPADTAAQAAPTATPAQPPPARPAGEPVKASPLARRIARERGIDLALLTGTGPEGRIVAEDVEQATTAVAEPTAAGAGDVEVVELTSVRRTIARRLTEAWQAPVFQLTVAADCTELLHLRERLVELRHEGEAKPTVNDVLTRLVAAALMRHRPVNATFVDGSIHRFATANVGIAVAAPSGLVVPVIRGAERRSVQEIAAARADLVTRARDGKLQLPDLEDGTFTISNLGMYGIDQFVAVLNPPQVAILAVGAIEDRPLVADGELVVRPQLTMTLTCDHRAIDGSEGADFLRTVKELVEAPALAL